MQNKSTTKFQEQIYFTEKKIVFPIHPYRWADENKQTERKYNQIRKKIYKLLIKVRSHI